MEHGCYPFCINQLFNREINIRLDKKRSIKQKILRIEVNNARVTNNQFSNISAIINFPDETNLFYIYFRGFLTDFITSVKLPIELSESEQSKEKKPVLPFDQPDECTVLCFKSNASIEFLRTHSWFEVKVRTYFGFSNVQVVVLSNFNSIKPSIYQLDPIQVVFLAYCEFILDAISIEQIDSPLSHCFSSMFAAFKNIGQNKFDTLMARYWAEAQVRNSYFDVIQYVQNCPMPETAEASEIFLKNLISLKNMANDDNMDPEMRQNTSFLRQALAREVYNDYGILLYGEDEVPEQEPKLIALHLHIIEIRKYLHRLHIDYSILAVQQNLKVVMAPLLYVLIKLKRLDSVERYTLVDKLVQTIQRTPSKLKEFLQVSSAGRNTWIFTTAAGLIFALMNNESSTMVGFSTLISCCSAVSEEYCSLGDYRNVLKSLRHIAISLLTSTGESVNENENEWELLIRVAQCDWSRELSQARSPDERDATWTRIFKKKPLKDISSEHRGNFVSVAELCRQLYKMRQILAQQSPKVVIVGQSQTGKSTLFAYLTERNLEELRNITNFNTRMSLQCSAFIKLDEKTNDNIIDDGSALQINIINSPGYDDATGQSDFLLNMSPNTANLFILMTTLDDMNRMGTIKLLDKILHSTQVKVLVLINKVDVSLKVAWEKFRKPDSDKYEDSDEDDSDKDELNEEFSRCETLNTLLQRPTEELIQGLTVDKMVLKSRVTFQPIILKGFNEFNKTFKEHNFRDKVHKSNVNKWIKQNLINSAN